ncbi:hypothetical protein Tco_0826450 [Tanacetum coccineum]
MHPYPRFTKLVMSHYMIAFPEISKLAHDRYHNLKEDVMIKSIFNSGKNKTIVGMRIPDWMITKEMKLMENYRLYAEVFGVDVPTTQSQPIHLMAKEIEKLVEGSEDVAENVVEYVDENVEVSSSPPRNDNIRNVLGTRLEPRSDKESPKVDSSVISYMSGHVLHVHPTQATTTNAQEQQHQLYLTMKDNPQPQQDDLLIWLALKYKLKRLHMATTPSRPSAIHPRDPSDPHDDAHLEGENSAKRQKTSKHGTFVFEESSSGQDYESEPGPSTLGNQDQSDDFDFWTNSYASDDDVLPNEKVSQELMDEMSQTVDEAKLRKVVDEIKKEIIVPPYQPKPTPVVQSCQRDPKAPALSLVNQDHLYLKKGNTVPEKIALSLHKFLAVRFPDNDIEERTSK